MAIGVGGKFPEFHLKAVDKKPLNELNINNVFVEISNDIHKDKWMMIFFYPKDFTFVCPTEIEAFGKLNEEFEARNCVVLTASTDTEFTHWAWRKHQSELNNLPIPMLADVRRELSSALGILDPVEGVSQRAVFIVDPGGTIRFSMVTDLNVGRNPDEVLRVLDALQTGELCQCNWNKGDSAIDLEKVSK